MHSAKNFAAVRQNCGERRFLKQVFPKFAAELRKHAAVRGRAVSDRFAHPLGRLQVDGNELGDALLGHGDAE